MWLRIHLGPYVCVIVAFATTGCGTQQQVTRYEVAKSDRDDSASDAAAADPHQGQSSGRFIRTHRDRMMAALLTRGDRTWSFKMSGPADQLAPYAEAFRELLSSVRESDGEMTWDTPAGWQQQPASGMRLATLLPSTQDAGIECSVIVLPQQDELANVNRWRGQMQLPAITAAELPNETETIAAAAGEILLVDITGSLSADASDAAVHGSPEQRARPVRTGGGSHFPVHILRARPLVAGTETPVAVRGLFDYGRWPPGRSFGRRAGPGRRRYRAECQSLAWAIRTAALVRRRNRAGTHDASDWRPGGENGRTDRGQMAPAPCWAGYSFAMIPLGSSS